MINQINDGQTASVWRAAINGITPFASPITRQSSDGTISGYSPSADTDVARGVALKQCCDEAVHGDLIMVGNGFYELADGQGLSIVDKSFSMIGIGNVHIKGGGGDNTTNPTTYKFNSSVANTKVVLENIAFETNYNNTNASATGNHSYNIRLDGDHTCRNCSFILNSTVTTLANGNSMKNFVNTSGKGTLVNCVIESYAPSTLDESKCFSMALHDCDGEVLNGCTVIGTNMVADLIGDYTEELMYTNCYTTGTLRGGALFCNASRAKQAAKSSLFNEANFMKSAMPVTPSETRVNIRVDGENGVDFYEASDGSTAGTNTNRGYRGIALIRRTVSGTANSGYTIEINGEDLSGKTIYRKFHVTDSGVTLLASNGGSTVVDLKKGGTGNSDILGVLVTGNGGSTFATRSFNGTLKFSPSMTQASSGKIDEEQYIEFLNRYEDA